MEQYRERGPVEEGRGVKIALNNETTAFKVGAQFAYNGSSNLTITLPENWYMCDFSWFTIWCETASVFFSRLEIPTTAFVSARWKLILFLKATTIPMPKNCYANRAI